MSSFITKAVSLYIYILKQSYLLCFTPKSGKKTIYLYHIYRHNLKLKSKKAPEYLKKVKTGIKESQPCCDSVSLVCSKQICLLLLHTVTVEHTNVVSSRQTCWQKVWGCQNQRAHDAAQRLILADFLNPDRSEAWQWQSALSPPVLLISGKPWNTSLSHNHLLDLCKELQAWHSNHGNLWGE